MDDVWPRCWIERGDNLGPLTCVLMAQWIELGKTERWKDRTSEVLLIRKGVECKWVGLRRSLQ